MSSDTAILLEAARPVEAELAKRLLEEAGIPYMTGGPDFDVAELGTAMHMNVRGVDILVPTKELERARQLLAEAWDGPLPGEDSLPNDGSGS